MAIKRDLQRGTIQAASGADWPGEKASAWFTIFDYTLLAGDTFTVNGVAFVEGVDFNAVSSEAATAGALRNAINASVDPLLDDITAGVDGSVVTLTADTAGAAGNSYTLSYTPGATAGAYESGSTFQGGYDTQPVGSAAPDSLVLGSPSSAIDIGSNNSVIMAGSTNAILNNSDRATIIGSLNSTLMQCGQGIIIGGDGHTVDGSAWAPVIIGGDECTVFEDEYATIIQSYGCRIQGNGTSNIIANSWTSSMTADGHWLATILSSDYCHMTAGWSYSGIYSTTYARISDNAEYSIIMGGEDNEINNADYYSCIFNGVENQINSGYGYNVILPSYGVTLEASSYAVLAHGDQHITNQEYILINGRRGYCATTYKNVQAAASDSLVASRVQCGSAMAWLKCTGTGGDVGITNIPIERKLYTNNDSSVMVYGFVAEVAIVQEGGTAGTVGDACYRRYEGAIKNIGGVTSLIGGVTEITIAEDTGAATWGISFTADDTNDQLDFAITGKEADKNLRATITIKTTEVGS